MKLHSQLYNLPVIDRDSGNILGYMRGISCQPVNKKIDGIIYEDKSLLRRCHYVPWQAVAVMGDFSIIIDCSTKGKHCKNLNSTFTSNKLYSSDGRYLGSISNYLIDEKTGAVLGMELSTSIVDDLKNGRKIIENRGNIIQGENYLILADNNDERRPDDEGLF